MKLVFVSLVLVLLISGCSGIPYTSSEKAALDFYIASSFADFRTTELALEHRVFFYTTFGAAHTIAAAHNNDVMR